MKEASTVSARLFFLNDTLRTFKGRLVHSAYLEMDIAYSVHRAHDVVVRSPFRIRDFYGVGSPLE